MLHAHDVRIFVDLGTVPDLNFEQIRITLLDIDSVSGSSHGSSMSFPTAEVWAHQ